MKKTLLSTGTVRRFSACLSLTFAVCAHTFAAYTDGVAKADKLEFAAGGMITDKETNAMKGMLIHNSGYQIPTTPLYDNAYVFRNQGKAIKACAQMFEITGDLVFLNRAIEYLDAAYYYRNGQPGGKKVKVKPFNKAADVWPVKQDIKDDKGNVTGTFYNAAVEQGEALSHFAHVAKLILQMPVLWDKNVAAGDKYGYGKTYKARALKYLDICDKTYDNWLKLFVHSGDNVFWRTDDNGKLFEPIAYNQAFMACNGLDMMAQCHALTGNATRVALYDGIVAANLNFFIGKTWKDNSLVKGKSYLQWRYNAPSKGTSPIEDIGHASFDCYALHNIYTGGRHSAVLKPLITDMANTVFDLIYGKGLDASGKYPGRMDGAYVDKFKDNYVRDLFIGLTAIRTDWYAKVAEINKSRMTKDVPMTAILLWCKAHRTAAPSSVKTVSAGKGRVRVTWKATDGKVTVLSSDDLLAWDKVGEADGATGYCDDSRPNRKYYRAVRVKGSVAGYSAIAVNNTISTGGVLYEINLKNGRAVARVWDNPNVKDVSIKDKVRYNGIDYAVTEIAANAFNAEINSGALPDDLKTVTIAAGVTKIGNAAFKKQRNLTKAVCTGVTALGDDVFETCVALKTIELPALTTINGQRTFRSSGLTEFNAPKLKTLNGREAFRNCKNLRIFRATALETISGGRVFEATLNLTDVYINKVKKMDAESFPNAGYKSSLLRVHMDNVSSVITRNNNFADTKTEFYVPSTLVTSYKKHTDWKNAVIKSAGTTTTAAKQSSLFVPDNTVTGIDAVQSDRKAEANGPIYDLSGRQVDASYKGIVIRNGRKYRQ